MAFNTQCVGQKNSTKLIDQLGIDLGVNFPFGQGVLSEGAYPLGINIYITGTHVTNGGKEFEILLGGEIIADYSGGIYFTTPVLINRRFDLFINENGRFGIKGYTGLGYTFHHIFSRTEGLTIKNQHTLGIDGGLLFIKSLGERWSFILRGGVMVAFTKRAKAYYGGTSLTSDVAWRHATFPLLIGISKKLKS